jgi:hypothetical protein
LDFRQVAKHKYIDYIFIIGGNNMEVIELSKQEEGALRVQAMTCGISFDEMVRAIYGEGVQVVSGKQGRKPMSGSKESSDNSIPVASYLTEKIEYNKMYESLPKSEEIIVQFNEHELEYKLQQWKIPKRSVKYNIKKVDNKNSARKIANSVKDSNEIEKACNGNLVYYEVISYEEALSFELRTIALIRVEKCNNETNVAYNINKSVLKKHNCNEAKFENELKKIVGEMIKK